MTPTQAKRRAGSTDVFHTASGRLTPYALACGYLEVFELDKVHLQLWSEHGSYQVRAHDHGEHGRLFWDTFRTLTEARKRFDSAKRGIQARSTL